MWLKKIFESKSSVSSGRIAFFLSMIMSFILTTTVVIMIILTKNELNIYYLGLLLIFPIFGLISYIITKSYENKIKIKIGDKELQIWSDKENENNENEDKK